MSEPLRLEVPPELLDRLADLAADRVLERLDRHSDNGDGGWLRGADQIATYIGAPRSRVYALASAGRLPVERDGSALLARRGDLDDWVRAGGGKRP